MFRGLKNKIKRAKRLQRRLKKIRRATGWSYSTAYSNLKEAKAKYGIGSKDYVKYELYNVDKADIKKEYKRLKKKAKHNKTREQCIELAMREKGWTRKQAKADLKECRDRTGATYKEYRRYYLFNIPKEEQAELLSEIRETGDLKVKVKKEKKNMQIDVIAEATGWDREKVKEMVGRARDTSGATVKDYYALRLWEVDPKDYNKYFTSNVSTAMSEFYNTNPFYRDIIMNKEQTSRYFNDFMRRPWAVNRDVTLEEFKEKFGKDGRLIYKPVNGKGGLGVTLYKFNDDNIEEVYNEIRGLRRGVLEGFVVQHPDMMRLNPNAVNTLRVVTVSKSKDGDPKNKEFFDIAYVAVRVGRGESIVDNASSGGMIAGVDKETGKIDTNAITTASEVFEAHPDTGTVFKGFQIPMFKEAMEFVKQAGQLVDGYIGWDLAISVNGPVLIEANSMPGNRILETPHLEERTGRRYVMQKYIDYMEDHR